MNKKRLSKNLIITFFVYAFLLVANVLVSKIVLTYYGSEINGLLSSVNQLYLYIALLEAGIGTATITALYKPISEEDNGEISRVCSASLAYYRGILKWYLLCVAIVSFVWPLILDTEINYWIIFGIIIIQGISNAFTFYFVNATSNYLMAAGKNYINVYSHAAITILTYLAKAVIVLLGGHVLFVSVALFTVNALKCMGYWAYKKVKCKDIDFHAKAEKSLLKQRNSFLVHEISGCVFAASDMILISVFCDLKMASVYAVYSMVSTAISSIIGQVFNSTKYILGDAYQKDGYVRVHDRFNTVYIAIVFSLFTITYLLFTPFISIYTNGIDDADYIDNYLPVLFVCIQLLSSCRNVDTTLIKNALHSKQTISRSIAETAINLIASVILLNFWGMHGVLAGTIIALLYRTNDIIIYANKKLLKRSAWYEYKLYLLNFALFGLFAFINLNFSIEATSYLELMLKAVVVAVMVAVVYLAFNYIFFRKSLKK